MRTRPEDLIEAVREVEERKARLADGTDDGFPLFLDEHITLDLGDAVELLGEVAQSGVEYSAGDYLTVQIDKGTWNSILEFLGLTLSEREDICTG